MTKHVKIVLSGSRDIPFNQLVLSQANVRRVKAGVSIDALAADIARRGLLQSLTVRAQHDAEGAETGLFEVPAGGRRFRALEKLVKQRRMAKTQGVPCIVRDDDQISAEEDSLAENVHREALHPLDQFRAMRQLVTQGTDVETVAATFMTTPAVVKQRLRLASVSPRLHEVYAEDGMTLEQLMAFSVSEDHERQEQVWELLQSSHNRQPYMIRAKLTEQSVRATDKRVRFVGLDTYVAAGGYVLRDLFEDDQGGWLQDVALLDAQVDEKLKAEGARIGEEGWKWVAVAVDFAYDYDDGMRVIDGDQPEMTEADEAQLTALREEAEALEAEWSSVADVPDEIDARVTAIDEEISAIVSRPLVYQPAEMARAGVFVSVDIDGSLYIERGYVRPEDEPVEEASEIGDEQGAVAVDREQQDDDADADTGTAIVSVGGAPGADNGGDEDEQDDLLRPLPDRLVTELTTHRTLALRNAVACHPQVAFAAVLHALTLDTFYHYSSAASCVEILVRGGSLGTHAPGMNDSASARAIDARHASWAERLPDQPQELWEVLIALSAEDQAALFAHCASFGINAVWEPANRYNEGRVSARTVSGRIEHSNVLARAADLDMVAAGWTATVDNYLGRVTKARILSAVDEAKGAEVAARLTGLKKPDMAKEAERVLADSGWLAEPLRTPSAEPVEDPAAIDGEPAVEAEAASEHDGGESEEPFAIAAE
ncbi:ParB/RepB/Spo0J family partition protein [Sphingomonas nostoxanthinifaciens]|uniref:ParB/RepB/Spo0J family partition protein n=1 Tax=Sphingomonas nostoxanthinifaciens TaxID=2872652 RepID=UPI001CC21B1C|nr:ParB/RepB/Spo0J family partition protein [Sphingomonas nostoxanthinifaciens]UAK25312.1 ParB/RepB/Spo0J family partition protein [Sphingomonas nostoxanthinifaciens]